MKTPAYKSPSNRRKAPAAATPHDYRYVGVAMSTELYDALSTYAENADRSKSWVMREALKQYLEENNETRHREYLDECEAEEADERNRLQEVAEREWLDASTEIGEANDEESRED